MNKNITPFVEMDPCLGRTKDSLCPSKMNSRDLLCYILNCRQTELNTLLFFLNKNNTKLSDIFGKRDTKIYENLLFIEKEKYKANRPPLG